MMRCRIVALVLATAGSGVAASESPEAFHGGFSVGLGTAYDGLGLRLEGGSNHFGLFAGIGFLAFFERDQTTKSAFGFSVGTRWYHGVREGFFASLNFTYSWWRTFSNYDLTTPGSPTNPGHLLTTTLVAGYRWRSAAGAFFEIGAGGGFFHKQNTFSCTNVGITCPPYPPPPAPETGVIPDIALGIGFDL